MADAQFKDDDDDFTIPAPKKKAEEEAFEIEIVDDTPPEDRGKAPIPEEEVEGDPDPDEIDQYSEKVQKRIAKLTAEKNDQRRKKEAAERQVNEASQLVVSYQNELSRLRDNETQTRSIALKEAEKRIASELLSARAAYKAAVESGDADAQADAQEALATASAERTHIARVMPVEAARQQPQQPQQPQYQQPQQQQPQPPIDPKTVKWVQSNPWFEADGNEAKTFTAYGIHYEMVGEGFDPNTDDYYTELDKRLGATYPDLSEGKSVTTPRKKPATVVASAQREPGSPTKVRLTSTEVDLAKKFGVTLEDFAKEKVRLERIGQ
ncbi:MAG TPA: hypothetical protein VMX15_04435 [Candidatus Heimdallarchaeota archaeon]|nr:hypothetical protein [Candidatus Heimdallarchaeota archaeon]